MANAVETHGAPARPDDTARDRALDLGKVRATPGEAVAGIHDGASLAVGGFGLCGVPMTLIRAVEELGVRELTTVSNNCGVDGWGLGILLSGQRIARSVNSYVGENSELTRQYRAGGIELELCPQGTLAARLSAGGSGIAAFYTQTGVGTVVAEGGLPQRYRPDGSVAVMSPPKETRFFNGREYVLEEGITCDFALVHAARGDRFGNLTYRASARNFNPLCAMAARITIAEVEELVEPGEIDPQDVHTPGVFVHRIVEVGRADKRIEKRTVRRAPAEGRS